MAEAAAANQDFVMGFICQTPAKWSTQSPPGLQSPQSLQPQGTLTSSGLWTPIHQSELQLSDGISLHLSHNLIRPSC